MSSSDGEGRPPSPGRQGGHPIYNCVKGKHDAEMPKTDGSAGGVCADCELRRLRPGWGTISDVLSVQESSSADASKAAHCEHWLAQPSPAPSPSTDGAFCLASARPGWGFLDDLRTPSLQGPPETGPPSGGAPLRRFNSQLWGSKSKLSKVDIDEMFEPNLAVSSVGDGVGGPRELFLLSNDPEKTFALSGRQDSTYALGQLNQAALPRQTSSTSLVSWVSRRSKPRVPRAVARRKIYGVDKPSDLDLSDSTSADSTSLGDEDELDKSGTTASSLLRPSFFHEAKKAVGGGGTAVRLGAVLGVGGVGDAVTEMRLRVRLPGPGETPRLHAALLLPYAPDLSQLGYPHHILFNGKTLNLPPNNP